MALARESAHLRLRLPAHLFIRDFSCLLAFAWRGAGSSNGPCALNHIKQRGHVFAQPTAAPRNGARSAHSSVLHHSASSWHARSAKGTRWSAFPSHSFYHCAPPSAMARAKTPPASPKPSHIETAKHLDLSNFHEALDFDSEGYAIPRPVNSRGAPPARATPESTSDRLSDSLIGMLSILQILPEHTRTWAARFTGYHSVDAMLLLREHLIAGSVKPPETYCISGSPAYDLITGTTVFQHSPAAQPQLQELLIDDGLPTLARLTDGTEIALPHRVHSREVLATLVHLAAIERAAPDLVLEGYLLLQQDSPPPPPTLHDDEAMDSRDLFSVQQRAGISGTLHRVAAIEASDGRITGLTVRIGRHVPSAAWPLTDVLTMIRRDSKHQRTDAEVTATASAAVNSGSGIGMPSSVLVLGGPGTGKTTLLRDFSQQLSVAFGLGRRVVIVDSSNEIGGQGRIPHPAVGRARRFMVPRQKKQADIMIQALTNHNPDVIVVDELSTAADVEAARSICHRGVTLVATAHATSLAYLLSNPQLNPVLGGLKDVTLSKDEVSSLAKDKKGSGSAGGAHSQRHAFARSVGSRTRMERRQPPCFQVVIEIVGPSAWRIHWNAAESIDALLVGAQPPSELRVMHGGRLLSRDESGTAL